MIQYGIVYFIIIILCLHIVRYVYDVNYNKLKLFLLRDNNNSGIKTNICFPHLKQRGYNNN